MEATSKSDLRFEICMLLKHIFVDIVANDDPERQKEWKDFQQLTDEGEQFWLRFHDIFKVILKWSKTPKNRIPCFCVMAMMLGVGPNEMRTKYGVSFVQSVQVWLWIP